MPSGIQTREQRTRVLTELGVWLVGAALVVVFVGGMWLTAWWEDRRQR